jgi:hypothetical protein
MRVAILIPGQPRNIKVAYDSLKAHYLDKHECDFFIHTWFDKKFPLQVYNEMLSLFVPKKILIEEQIIFDDKGIKDPLWNTPLQNLLSMYYSMYMANQLKCLYEEEKKFKYDFVMKMRSDLRIDRPIPLEEIEKGKLALYNWTQLVYNDIGSSDVFAVGPSDIMDIYSDLYSKCLYYLYEDPTYVIRDPKMRAEYILNHHLKTVNKVPIQIFWHGDQSDPSFHLIR